MAPKLTSAAGLALCQILLLLAVVVASATLKPEWLDAIRFAAEPGVVLQGRLVGDQRRVAAGTPVRDGADEASKLLGYVRCDRGGGSVELLLQERPAGRFELRRQQHRVDARWVLQRTLGRPDVQQEFFR